MSPLSPQSASASAPTPGLKRVFAKNSPIRRVFCLAAALGAGVWLWGWLSVDETGQSVTATSDEPQAEIEGLKKLILRRDGAPFWEISARRASVSANGTSTLATGVDRAVLFQGGNPFLHLSAPIVRFSNLSNNLEASGGVNAVGVDTNGAEAVGAKRFSFQTARALWLSASQTVRCPKPATAWLRDFYFATPQLAYNWKNGVLTCPEAVEVRTEGAVFRGKNLEATLKTKNIKLSGGVQIIVAPSAVQKLISKPKS